MTIQKNQTVRRDYRITVSDPNGKTYTTVQVRAEGVLDALKKACETVSGWQGVKQDSLS